MALLDSRMRWNEYRRQLTLFEAEQGKAWAELEAKVREAEKHVAGSLTLHALVNGAQPS